MTDTPLTLRRLSDLRALTRQWRATGQSIGVVPTMGALHEGHLSLVRQAKADCDRVIVTIFVNPRQFNRPSDLDKYPRTEAADAAMLAPMEIDALWAPGGDEMYPEGFATTVSISGLTDVLCGAHRPGHFDGVATVCTKLFLQTDADNAYFGEKDFQQVQVVRRLVTDLNIPTEIIGCPIIRETDGLAMSSRNVRLEPTARMAAAALFRALSEAADALASGTPWPDVSENARAGLMRDGFETVEYFDLRSDENLRSLDEVQAGSRLFVAAWIGGVRLIDNMPVDGGPATLSEGRVTISA